jgi:hypothetical protein
MPDVSYAWIRKWGEHVGLRPYQILAIVAQAHQEAAPPDAIYRDRRGGWKTIRDIRDRETRRALGLIPPRGGSRGES